nr:hypothetical protein [Tanacetum cinerariifolium]
MIAFLTKSDASEGFDQTIDFLNASAIKYALTVNPNIYVSIIKQFWSSVLVKQVNGVTRLQALVYRKKVLITEEIVREALHLDDAESIDCLPNEEIFTELARMGLVRNVDSSSKFYMYPRFLQLMIKVQVGDLSSHTTKYSSPSLTHKVFANMRRVGKGFSGVETPLFEGMIVVQQADDVADKGVAGVNVDDVIRTPSPSPIAQPPSPPQQQQPLQPTHDVEISLDLLYTLLETCTTLTRRVEHLELDKIAQALEITKLKQRVKKLERKNKLKVFRLRRLKKVRTAQRVESSEDTVIDDEVEDAKNVEVLRMQDDELEPAELKEVVEVVTTAKLMTKVVTVVAATITVVATAAPTITTAPSTARRRKGVVIRDLEETVTPSTIIHSEPKSKDKGKGIMVQEPKPLKKKAQIEQDEAYYFNSNVAFLEKTKEQLEEEKSRALKRKDESSEENIAKKQELDEKVEELRKHLQIVLNDDDDDVYTEDTPYALKCSWNSKGQKLEIVRVLWSADYNVHYNTDDLPGREKISINKVYSGSNAQQFMLKRLNDVVDLKLRLLEQSVVAGTRRKNIAKYLLLSARVKDLTVYSKFDDFGKGVIICLYVDDMLSFGTDQNQVDKTKKFLSSRFSMKDMGKADIILGIKIKRENKGIVITQSHYIEKILKKFNREDCSLVRTPMDLVEKLKPNTGKHVDQLEYSRAISFLMYVMTSTRPDITYVVDRLSSAPTMARACSQIYNGKSRHLGIRHSMVRELIKNGVIYIEFVQTQHNLADHLTKGLARDLVTEALSCAGLESSNLIVGIDFTKSNEWTGTRSYHFNSLHHIGNGLNPYEHAISIIGKTLAKFDEDNLIPCYGFVDGPTSFAPVIEQAMTIVEKSGGQYHVLLIIADGQVTHNGYISVGVRDGPWDKMKEFDDNIPHRQFDNIQFVNFTEIMSKNVPSNKKEAEFALTALMEIPSQYKATIELNLLGNQRGNLPQRVALPPPIHEPSSCSSSKSSHSASFYMGSTSNNGHNSPVKSIPSNSQTSTDVMSAGKCSSCARFAGAQLKQE